MEVGLMTVITHIGRLPIYWMNESVEDCPEVIVQGYIVQGIFSGDINWGIFCREYFLISSSKTQYYHAVSSVQVQFRLKD